MLGGIVPHLHKHVKCPYQTGYPKAIPPHFRAHEKVAQHIYVPLKISTVFFRVNSGSAGSKYFCRPG